MLIDSYLFVGQRNRFQNRYVPLSAVLDGHKARTVNAIKGVSDLDQLTDAFLAAVVRDSLVERLSFHFTEMTQQTRTEQFDASQLPGDFISLERGRRYPRTIARISIPFSGDLQLLQITPSRATSDYPMAQVSGNTVQFDVVFWGLPNDNEQVKQKIEKTRKLLEFYGGAANADVKAFNDSLPAQIKEAFAAKLDELTKQCAVLEGFGIAEEPKPAIHASNTAPVRPKKGKARAEQIIRYVENLYVQTLNQTNYNAGDVNNAIQSD